LDVGDTETLRQVMGHPSPCGRRVWLNPLRHARL
jgi:hypothetical protein